MSVDLPVGADLLSQVLRPYRENCRYLLNAQVVRNGEEVAARGRFAIPDSCYIDDTGHFNAVEFNICYNQLTYYLIARCVEDRLYEFARWSMADYWQRQLSDILIYRFSSRFKRMINPRDFEGEVVFRKPVVRKRADGSPLMVIDTSCSWRDDNGGAADGEVKIALTGVPDA